MLGVVSRLLPRVVDDRHMARVVALQVPEGP